MICPECGAKLANGTGECRECHVEFCDDPADAETDSDYCAGEGDLDLLIRTGLVDPVAIGLARSLLHDAEIPFFAMDQNVAARQESGNIVGFWSIRVPRDREAEVREILRSVEEMR
jgi:hypothetical protein